MIRRILAAALVLAAAFTALGPAQAQPRPTIVVGLTFITPSLDPSEGNAGWALTSHGVTEQLFTVSRDGQVVPNVAASVERLSEMTWRVTLRSDRFFSDGTPVTAAEVAAAITRGQDRNAAASATTGRMSIAVVDGLTLDMTTERPTPNMASALAEWGLPIYRSLPNGSFAYTGAYRPVAFTSGSTLTLEPNPFFAGAASRPNITIRRFTDGQALALGLLSGEVDLAFNLPVETLQTIRANPNLTARSFPVAYQYMMWFNTEDPILSDRVVRQAVALAIDRAELTAAVRAGIPTASAYAASFPFASTATPVFDLAAANAMLDAAGWVRGSDGIRSRAGTRLSLELFAYPQRPDLVTFQPVLQTQLRRLGVEVVTRLTEAATATAQSGAFDLLLWAQHTAPAGDPNFFLSLFLGEGAANNFARWSSPAFQTALAELAQTSDPAARAAIARVAQAIVANEMPVAFLATPEWHVGLSARLRNYEPWGSDYYIIRPDLTLAP